MQSFLYFMTYLVIKFQVFDMVNHETYNPLPGISVTGMREDFLQLAIGQETSVCLCLVPSGKEDGSQMVDSKGDSQNGESGLLNSDSMDLAIVGDDQHDFLKMNLSGMPNPVSLEIYLLFIFHENVLARAKERRSCATRAQVPGQPADGSLAVQPSVSLAGRSRCHAGMAHPGTDGPSCAHLQSAT